MLDTDHGHEYIGPKRVQSRVVDTRSAGHEQDGGDDKQSWHLVFADRKVRQ